MAAGMENPVEQGSVVADAAEGAAKAPVADAAIELVFAEDPTAEAVERAREGERTGWIAAHGDAESGDLTVALIARPAVRMGDFHAVPFVAAMGVRDAFAGLGAAANIGVRWPHDLVCGAPDFSQELATVQVKAGAGEGGMFAVVEIAVRAEAVAGLGLTAPALAAPGDAAATGDSAACTVAGEDADKRECVADGSAVALSAGAEAAGVDDAGDADASALIDAAALVAHLAPAVLARLDSWAAALASNRAVAGPLAPVLDEYFDMVPALGHRAAAVSPSGHPLAIGTFAGVDVWGRATIKTTVDEREFAPEVARIRTL